MHEKFETAPVVVDVTNAIVLGTDADTAICWASTHPEDQKSVDELLAEGWDVEEISQATLRPFIDESTTGIQRLSQLLQAREDAEALSQYAAGRASRALLVAVAETLIDRGIAVPGRADKLVFRRVSGFGRLIYQFSGLRTETFRLGPSETYDVLDEVETAYEGETLADLLFLPMVPNQLQHFLRDDIQRVGLGWMLDDYLTTTVINHDPDSDKAPELLLVGVDALHAIDQNC